MAHHLINCPRVASDVRKVAEREKSRLGNARKARKGLSVNKDDADGGDADDESDPQRPAKRKRLEDTKKAMKQSQLKLFSGLNIPFKPEQKTIVQAQFLPFRWTDNPEIIKLFLMMRATADNVIPERRVLAGRLLDDAAKRVDEDIRGSIKGKYVSAL